MADPGPCEDPEVNQGGGKVRAGQGIEETNHDEGNDALQVVPVASVGKKGRVGLKATGSMFDNQKTRCI